MQERLAGQELGRQTEVLEAGVHLADLRDQGGVRQHLPGGGGGVPGAGQGGEGPQGEAQGEGQESLTEDHPDDTIPTSFWKHGNVIHV